MKALDPHNPMSSAIQANQTRLQTLRQNRPDPSGTTYSSVANEATTSSPKSIEEWKAILEDRKVLLTKTAMSQNVSTVLLWQVQPPRHQSDSIPVSLSENQRVSPPVPSLPPPSAITPEVLSMSQSLVSVFEKILSFPPRRTESSTPIAPASTALVVRTPERDRSLDHLRFPGQEPESDSTDIVDPSGGAQIPWEPIFPRVERLDHITFPPEKSKTQLLLGRQMRDDKGPKK